VKILIQPHDDDAFLFACFTLIRERPLLVTVFDSYLQPSRGIQGCSARERRRETNQACMVLGDLPSLRLGFRDDAKPTTEQIALRLGECVGDLGGAAIWAPAQEPFGHPQHDLCAPLGNRHYMTYTERGKSVGREVEFVPRWLQIKLIALSCFESQFQSATGCVDHFIGRSLREYEL
jgi:hypothetical protein